jgi:dienelactone hydrolase
MHITAQAISYRDGDTDLSGWLFFDESSRATRPGLLVVHGGAGLDDHAKSRARGFAEQGYLALACDMYGAEVAAAGRARIMPLILQLCAQPAKLRHRANAGLDVLRSHPLVDSTRLAAIGYCFGGMTVLELARGGADLSAVISVHGSLQPAQTIAQTHAPKSAQAEPVQPASPQLPSAAATSSSASSTPSVAPASPAIRARILVCHGALDPHVPMSHVTAFADEMAAARADYQLIIYANALHGFTHETASATPGVAYHAQADARSSAHIRAFLAGVFTP